MGKYILDLAEVNIGDIAKVGGKNASLGEMIQHLSPLGVNIPGGFVITVEAYRHFIEKNYLDEKIRKIVAEIDFDSIESLRRAGLKIRQLIQNGTTPVGLEVEIRAAYANLSRDYDQEATDVAVRSSATAEDLPDASFAGQQETYLNVRGTQSIEEAVRKCFASLFTDRAISYRHNFNFDHFDVGLSVCVQKMVRSDLASSGVAFSLDTESGFKDVVVINGSYGLGETVVQGTVSPDEFIVFKPTLKQGFSSIVDKKLGVKDRMMVYGDDPDERTRIIPVEKAMQHRFSISDKEVLELSHWVVQIENYYTSLKGHWCPMDVEWAVDGLSDKLFIVQARPETIHSRRDQGKINEYILPEEELGKPRIKLLSGIAVGSKIGMGKANILFSLDKRVIEGHEFSAGDVLVTDMTDPDWEPIMKKASAIITNKGGRTCHAAIVARELGVPAIVGCGNATEVLNEGQLITASCAEGETGFVYDGLVLFSQCEIDLKKLPGTRTAIMLNVASPEQAFHFSHYPNQGVGLAREEFIINNYIKAHPLALLRHRSLGDRELTEKIEKLTTGYESGEDFFVKKLSYGIARIASAFFPSKVIVRFSDFKSNEYSNLLGGNHFEPDEENPMIGWRGAARYYSDAYSEAFGLECRAIKKVREELGLKNVVVMIPFCRTVEELLQVKATMAGFGLLQGQDGLELYLMAEIPSNVLMADEFALHIDGFSIGSNDLTQLTLGLDRDSALVAKIYDERNEAVKRMIKMLILAAKRNNVKVGICGQGPSDYPDFAQFLVEQGIDSISVTPDSVARTLMAVSEIEQSLSRKAVQFNLGRPAFKHELEERS